MAIEENNAILDYAKLHHETPVEKIAEDFGKNLNTVRSLLQRRGLGSRRHRYEALISLGSAGLIQEALRKGEAIKVAQGFQVFAKVMKSRAVRAKVGTRGAQAQLYYLFVKDTFTGCCRVYPIVRRGEEDICTLLARHVEHFKVTEGLDVIWHLHSTEHSLKGIFSQHIWDSHSIHVGVMEDNFQAEYEVAERIFQQPDIIESKEDFDNLHRARLPSYIELGGEAAELNSLSLEGEKMELMGQGFLLQGSEGGHNVRGLNIMSRFEADPEAYGSVLTPKLLRQKYGHLVLDGLKRKTLIPDHRLTEWREIRGEHRDEPIEVSIDGECFSFTSWWDLLKKMIQIAFPEGEKWTDIAGCDHTGLPSNYEYWAVEHCFDEVARLAKKGGIKFRYLK